MRACLAAVALTALVVAGLLVVAPKAHAELHDDATSNAHYCAVSIVGIGFAADSSEPPSVSPSSAVLEAGRITSHSYHWSTPSYWIYPANGPPADNS